MPKLNYINFKQIENGNIGIYYEDHYYDLHNFADFQEMIYDIDQRKVTLVWNYPGKWFKRNENGYHDDKTYIFTNDIWEHDRLIALVFNQVTRFGVKPRDPEMPLTEDSCVSGMYNYDEEDNYKEDVLVLEFQSDTKIIIEAEDVIFEKDYHK